MKVTIESRYCCGIGPPTMIAVTRVFAKIIDGVNTLSLEELQRAR